MKRLILFLLLIASPCYGQEYMQLARMNPYVAAASAGGAAAACSNSTDYVGQKADGYTTDFSYSAGYLDCTAYTATCPSGCSTGTLDTAYVTHGNTSAQSITMYVYSRAAATPSAGDAKLATSGLISSSAVETASAAISGTVSVTCGADYWVCAMASAGGFATDKSTGVTIYYKNVSGKAPDTLGTGWSSEANDKVQTWVTIK